MSACRKHIILSVFFLAGTFCAVGQQSPGISGEFSDLSFEQFARKVESQSRYHFFFNPAQTDSLRINFSASAVALKDILDKLFTHTDFHYAIDEDNEVFITRTFRIRTDPFTDSTGGGHSPGLNSGELELDDYLSGERKARARSAAELKRYVIGTRTATFGKGRAVLTGYVRDSKSGEAIAGATVYLDNPPVGVSTDGFGYFSLNLAAGSHILRISSVGMKETRRSIDLYSDGKFNIEMEQFVPGLKTVTVVGGKNSNTGRLSMGVERLNIKLIKQVPVVFGEADVLRVVLTLPGVTSVGEASSGFNVRGGAADQNLVLFNDATIYNSAHFFGFFSAFNPDIIKGVELYKSSIPEKFGGRLSSVLDVTTKDGNKKKLSGAGGIGPLTARLTLEGPLFNDKTTFLIAGRSTYSDWLIHTIPNKDYANSSAGFYDMNLKLSHEFDSRNSLYLTGYFSNDQFRLNNDTLYRYQNRNANLKWKHIYSSKLNAVLTTGFDGYNYSITSNINPINAYRYSFNIGQYNFKTDFNYVPGTAHNISFGISSLLYTLKPGTFDPRGKSSLVVPNEVPPEKALESALYLGDQFTISPNLSVSAGLRYSMFSYLGPHDQYNYAAGVPRSLSSLKDSTYFGPGKFIKTYHGPEIRLSARYNLGSTSSVKLSYNTLRQYIHQLSNTTSISPTDVWKLSDAHIQPQWGDQMSLGYYRNFALGTIETSIEVYYKRIKHYLDYKSGAALQLNHHVETDVINTRGRAYGVEFLLKRTAGKLNGWISYTYSRTLLRQDDPIAGETINQGKFYPANFDRPQNLNFVGNFQVNHRFSISLNANYSTGRPITLPTAIYDLGGAERVLYSQRNAYRIPDYFRTDLSVNVEGNHKIKKFSHNSWTFGLYNLTGRKNPYSIYFVEEQGVVKGYKLSVFGTIIPSITYNFRF